jgi:hypothetical protein
MEYNRIQSSTIQVNSILTTVTQQNKIKIPYNGSHGTIQYYTTQIQFNTLGNAIQYGAK